MARRLVNVTFEIDSITGRATIVRRKQVPLKRSPASSREVLERTPIAFLLPKGRTPRQDEETLHHVLRNMIGNPV